MHDISALELVFGLLLAASFASVLRARQTQRWCRVEANVVAVADRSRGTIDEEGGGDHLSAYEARVRYAAGGLPVEAVVTLDAPPGDHLVVYFDPKRPSSVVLRPGMSREHWWPLLLLGIFSGVVFVMLLLRRSL